MTCQSAQCSLEIMCSYSIRYIHRTHRCMHFRNRCWTATRAWRRPSCRVSRSAPSVWCPSTAVGIAFKSWTTIPMTTRSGAWSSSWTLAAIWMSALMFCVKFAQTLWRCHFRQPNAYCPISSQSVNYSISYVSHISNQWYLLIDETWSIDAADILNKLTKGIVLQAQVAGYNSHNIPEIYLFASLGPNVSKKPHHSERDGKRERAR